MPAYELTVESGSIPTIVWETFSPETLALTYAGFKETVGKNVLDRTFGAGNYTVGAGVLLTKTKIVNGESQTYYEYGAVVTSQVVIPPDQLPPQLTSSELAVGAATAGPESDGNTQSAQPPPTSEPTPVEEPPPPVEEPPPTTEPAPVENPPVEEPPPPVEEPPTNSPAPVNPENTGFSDGAGAGDGAGEGTPTTNSPAPVDPENTGFGGVGAGAGDGAGGGAGAGDGAGGGAGAGGGDQTETNASSAVQVGKQLAQQQAVLAAQKKTVNNGDWRVRLSLAPGARYLYNVDGDPGILQPLRLTDGVIFPYTPKIETSYKADYENYALTHSNYKGYFYKSSYVDAVNMTATFTAQDTKEANYLLAVIHFFRSVTKMFYGQDPQRGAPPPLVYLSGLGEYQFAAHPCVVTSFNYTLPNDVDYIRARSTNINGANMLTRRDKQDLPTNPISGAVARLNALFNSQKISYGAEICRPPPPTLGQNSPTYVPTKMEITLSLLPMQTRSQVTNQFSLRDYASGALLKGGFW